MSRESIEAASLIKSFLQKQMMMGVVQTKYEVYVVGLGRGVERRIGLAVGMGLFYVFES